MLYCSTGVNHNIAASHDAAAEYSFIATGAKRHQWPCRADDIAICRAGVKRSQHFRLRIAAARGCVGSLSNGEPAATPMRGIAIRINIGDRVILDATSLQLPDRMSMNDEFYALISDHANIR